VYLANHKKALCTAFAPMACLSVGIPAAILGEGLALLGGYGARRALTQQGYLRRGGWARTASIAFALACVEAPLAVQAASGRPVPGVALSARW